MRRGKFIAAIGGAPGPTVATPGLGNPVGAEVLDAPSVLRAPAGEVTG